MSARHDFTVASGPALPSARVFILLAVILALMAGQFIDWAYGRFQSPADEARVFASWTGLTLAANLGAFAVVPLARRIFESVPACRRGIAAWVVVYGTFAVVAAALMALRSAAGHHWLPEIFHARAAAIAALNGFFVNLLLFAVAERSAAGDRDSRAHMARLLRLSEELTGSKAQMVAEDDRMRAEVARMLHGELQTLLLLNWADLGEAMARRAQDRSAYDHKLDEVEHRYARAAEVLESGLAGWLGTVGDAGDLGVALERLAAAFAPVLPVKLELDPRLKSMGTSLPSAATRAALRLVQEALLNALKHARAQEVRVVGEPGSDGGVNLRVIDDGRGFGTLGVRGIGYSVLGQELVAHGGCWSVTSAPGKGTRLQIGLIAKGRVA